MPKINLVANLKSNRDSGKKLFLAILPIIIKKYLFLIFMIYFKLTSIFNNLINNIKEDFHSNVISKPGLLCNLLIMLFLNQGYYVIC